MSKTREQNMRNIEKIMNLYSSLAAEIANTISFDAVCKLDTYELKSLSLYATNFLEGAEK